MSISPRFWRLPGLCACDAVRPPCPMAQHDRQRDKHTALYQAGATVKGQCPVEVTRRQVGASGPDRRTPNAPAIAASGHPALGER